MLTNPAVITLVKIALTFAVMLFAISRRWPLWLAILAGGALMGFLFGLAPAAIGSAALGSLSRPDAVALFGVVFFIMLLSAIQARTGQGRRLVAGLTPYMKSPRLRLAFFPALIGLLGVPGGAIFSCPMVRDVAEGYDMPPRTLVIVNYWFRHIWELAWPLYPEYLMICVLVGISPAVLWRYTFPFVIFNCIVGWLFFLRKPIGRLPAVTEPEREKRPLPVVLLDALPIVCGIAFAPVITVLFNAFGISAPSGTAFAVSFCLACVVAMLQNAIRPGELPALILQPTVGKMLALVLTVFVFKDIVIASRVVDSLAGAAGKGTLLALAVGLPFVMGALTGILLGYVGPGLPLMLALIAQAGLYDERLPWVILTLLAASFGQMVTPMHSCYLVTLEFFKVGFSETWRSIFLASLTQFCLGCTYLAILYLFFRPLLP